MSSDTPRTDVRPGAVGLVDTRWALAGGSFAALFALGLMVMVGRLGDYEARLLLEASLPTIRALASSVMLSSATILALMLTLLSLSYSTEVELESAHYQRIWLAALMSVVALLTSLVVLVGLTFPLQESEQLRSIYNAVYYVVMGASALLGGLMVTVVLMLLNAIREMVQVLHPGDRDR